MALTNTTQEIPKLRINSFPTLAAYQSAYTQGLIDENEISFIDENVPNIPIPTANDIGKVLVVNQAGSYALVDPSTL